MTPERQAICDRLNEAIREHQTAEEHTKNIGREVLKIEDALAEHDKAAFAAARKGAA